MIDNDMAAPYKTERRQAFRFASLIDIDLILVNGTVLPAVTCNFSQQGLQFKCDSWLVDEIEPRGIHLHLQDKIQLKVVATLPVDGGSKLYSRCKIASARRLSQDEYMLGLEFTGFEKDSEKILKSYLQSLSPESD